MQALPLGRPVTPPLPFPLPKKITQKALRDKVEKLQEALWQAERALEGPNRPSAKRRKIEKKEQDAAEELIDRLAHIRFIERTS